MLDAQDARSIMGATAYGSDGDKIGKVGQVFLDDQSGRPEFVTVNTGFFGSNETFIPVSGATFSSDRLEVPYSKDKVKGAPNVGVDSGHLDESEEQRLYEYYGMGYGQSDTSYSGTETTTSGYTGTTGTTTGTTTGGIAPEGHDTSGPTTDDAMTRSEEQVRVGTQSREAGRARLRKWIEKDTETHTVPVTREEAVVQREPITDANIGNATSGPELSEEEHEVVLTEETAVVDKDVTPVERVRLGTQAVTEQETVTTDVAKERIEVEGDTTTTGTTGTTGTTDRI
ncbi:MAG: putative conserved domain protein [uncultured Nocardioidaceae bacterium]|uniref:Putative conserved domain protein n=1 Tax=uncultured Nocardioidaceae bacterium TaxID=253824 RepID=A0A6J4LLY7_9ACTN|nr:MAG: putative conserved domain protein [uncultured Nocardioidaceae bacterium]